MEKNTFKISGYPMILLILAGLIIGILSIIKFSVILGIILISLAVIGCCGLVIVAPNKVAVVTFFGKYTGCVKENGLWFIVPFSTYKMISIKVRNFNSEKLKVNDINGNPVEIAAVVVFKVVNSYKAIFDVDNYEEFVEIQSETALRHVAAKYPYDNYETDGLSLRGNSDDIANELEKELQARLGVAGVEIVEARLTHLAYATEIASAMLQRQQAQAILAARQIIVDGAVGMAQMAISRLENENVIDLDMERKVAMINNLMVTIVSDRSAQPVINTGSVY